MAVDCRFLYGNYLTPETNASKSNKALNPKYVLWSPSDEDCANRGTHFYHASFWIFHRVKDLGEDVYQIEQVEAILRNPKARGQILTVKGRDRGLDPEKYVTDKGRLVFLEDRNTSSDYMDVATFWRICTYDWLGLRYSFQSFATGEYLYLE